MDPADDSGIHSLAICRSRLQRDRNLVLVSPLDRNPPSLGRRKMGTQRPMGTSHFRRRRDRLCRHGCHLRPVGLVPGLPLRMVLTPQKQKATNLQVPPTGALGRTGAPPPTCNFRTMRILSLKPGSVPTASVASVDHFLPRLRGTALDNLGMRPIGSPFAVSSNQSSSSFLAWREKLRDHSAPLGL